MNDFQPTKPTQQKQISPELKAKLIKRRKIRRATRVVFPLVITLLVVLLGFIFWNRNFNTGIKKNEYQAVFLTNGQVYFGKLQNTNGEYLRMTDVYYLQVQNAQTQSDTKAQTQTQQTTGEPQLIKLGNELHAPEDELHIMRAQLSFWENLKDSGKVVQAIKSYKKK